MTEKVEKPNPKKPFFLVYDDDFYVDTGSLTHDKEEAYEKAEALKNAYGDTYYVAQCVPVGVAKVGMFDLGPEDWEEEEEEEEGVDNT